MILRKNSLKYKIFQSLAFLGDAGLELFMNEILVSGKVRFAGRKKYNSRHFERMFKELTTTGYIERVRNKKGVEYLKLSANGQSKIFNLVPLPSLQKNKWDGYYRGLCYDFPEKIRWKRSALREKIKEWGMGKYQLSLWITPHLFEDVIGDFIKAQKIKKYACIFISQKMSSEEGREIAEKVWGVSELEESYLKFIDKWGEKIDENNLRDADMEKIRFDYFSLLESDPYLPFDLLTEHWPAEEAKATFFAVEKKLKKRVK